MAAPPFLIEEEAESAAFIGGQVMCAAAAMAAEGDAESVQGEVEGDLVAHNVAIIMSAPFPVFEWDDGLVFDDDVREDDSACNALSQVLSLPPPALSRSDFEVSPVLEQALELGPESSLHVWPATPQRIGRIVLTPFSSPGHSYVFASTINTLGGRTVKSITMENSMLGRETPPSNITDDSSSGLFGSVVIGGLGAPSSVISSGGGDHIVPESALIELPSMEPAPGPVERGETMLNDTAHTSSVYALNDSLASQIAFGDTLQLDMQQIIALGHAPTRQRLSAEEAQTLPRVRFEAPDMQSCSICLEIFRHAMLLTILNCGHVFHVECLAQWLQHSAQCPNCRTHVEPFRPLSRSMARTS